MMSNDANTLRPKGWKTVLLVLLALIPNLLWANSGRIIYVSGYVTVERAERLYSAVQNAKLIEGDVIRTGSTGRVHVRMSDRSLFSLKPNSDFTIEEYRFPEPIEAKGRVRDTRSSVSRSQPEDKDPISIYRLLRGGMRAVTGLIGKEQRERYSVRTLVATIGVRGTSFTADLTEPDSLVSAGLPSGIQTNQVLTVGVSDGAVILTNSAGSLRLENGEYARVGSESTQPERILVPEPDPEAEPDTEGAQEEESEPAGEGPETGGGDTGTSDEEFATRHQNVDDKDGTTGGSSTPNQEDNLVTEETEAVDQQLGPRLSFTHTVGTVQSQSENSRVDQEPTVNTFQLTTDALQQDATGNVTAFVGALRDSNGNTIPGVIELADGSISNAGFDPMTDLRWGRWSGDTAVVRFGDGSEESLTLDSAQIHTIQSVIRESSPLMPSIGSATYRLVGNTDPTSASGAVGVLGSAQFSANFETFAISSAIRLGIDGQVWDAQGNGLLGRGLSAGTPAHHFAGQYPTVTIDGNATGNGVFSGFFTNNALGAGLGYTLRGSSETVTGTAAFRRE